MNYPNPCDSCKKECVPGGCSKWKTRYRYRQKQINGYFHKLLKRVGPVREKFLYEHPDEIRRYLENGPCKGCNAEEVCDTPCPAYLRWWDSRMEWMKRIYAHTAMETVQAGHRRHIV